MVVVTMQDIILSISVILCLTKIRKKIIASSLTQLTEVYGSSNRMEKALLMKVQEKVKGKQLKIKLLTIDCHCQNKEYLREKEEDINH